MPPSADRTAFTLPLHRLCGIQAIYFLLTGLWPLVHLPSFLAITGPKTDTWLVRTVGVLVIVMGTVLWRAFRLRLHQNGSVAMLGLGSALGFLLVDLTSVLTRAVGPIYLVDAAAHVVFLAGWVLLRVPRPPWPLAASTAVAGPATDPRFEVDWPRNRRSYATWIIILLLLALIITGWMGLHQPGAEEAFDGLP